MGLSATRERCTIVYTDGYAPPEQMAGKPEPRSDLFALAATLYHLTTGKVPQGWHTAAEIEADLKSGTLSAEHRWFFELLRINLAEDVNDRYFSASDFKADLQKRRVSKTQSCTKCRTVNEARKPYCVACAAPLTEARVACRECGRDLRMGSRYCIHCGHSLR